MLIQILWSLVRIGICRGTIQRALFVQQHRHMVTAEFRQAPKTVASLEHGNEASLTMVVGQCHNFFYHPRIPLRRQINVGHIVILMSVKSGRNQNELRFKALEVIDKVVLDQGFVLLVALAGQDRIVFGESIP